MPHKIGAYIRVSTEEQAQVIEGSLESQKFRINAYVDIRKSQESGWGEVHEFYIDDGYSAKDTRRPKYQKMMRDLRLGKINLILVTDLSRLSRNISDFCGLMEELEHHKAKFLSIKEQFDSSTPAGEMMLYNMINLAQFERKQTSERVATNFHARAMRGLRNGGSLLLGFQSDPVNKGKIIVHKEEASWVRKVFEIYLEKGSLRETAATLNQLGVPRKRNQKKTARIAASNKWTFGAVKNLLTSRAYVGDREVNKSNKDIDQEHLKPWQRYHVVENAWPAIIDRTTFESVQRLLLDARKLHREKLKKGKRRVFLLSGVLKCGDCGRALVGQSNHGVKSVHRYYAHKEDIPNESKECSHHRISADVLENTVVNYLSEVTQRAGHLDRVEKSVSKVGRAGRRELKDQISSYKKKLVKIDQEIESVFKFQLKGNLSKKSASLVDKQLNNLADQKASIEDHLTDLHTKSETLLDTKLVMRGIEDRLETFQKGVKRAKPTQIKRLLRNLFDVILLKQDRLEGHYFMAEQMAVSRQSSNAKEASGVLPEASSNLIQFPKKSDPAAIWQSGVQKFAYCANWWSGSGSNRRPLRCQRNALPAELPPQVSFR